MQLRTSSTLVLVPYDSNIGIFMARDIFVDQDVMCYDSFLRGVTVT